MNDSRFLAAHLSRSRGCRRPVRYPTVRNRVSRLSELLRRVFAAPWRLHGYRNLNTRLVRDGFCLRDCRTDAGD